MNRIMQGVMGGALAASRSKLIIYKARAIGTLDPVRPSAQVVSA